MQKRKDKGAAICFFKRLLKGQGVMPLKIVTDKLASYSAAKLIAQKGLDVTLKISKFGDYPAPIYSKYFKQAYYFLEYYNPKFQNDNNPRYRDDYEIFSIEIEERYPTYS